MSFVRLRPLFASSAFRLSAIYAAILVSAFALAGAVTLVVSASAAQREIRERVGLEMSALQQEMRSEGMGPAVAAIRARMESAGSFDYQLIAGDGRVLIHELDIRAPRLGWSIVTFRDHSARDVENEKFLVLTAATPDGGTLSIGDDIDRAERVRGRVLQTLSWVGAGALILALLAGVMATRVTLRRMRILSDTMLRVGAGDLSARAPTGGSDDVAQLSQSINDMVTRLQLLIANVRRVSTDIAHDLRTPLTHVRQQLEGAAHAEDAGVARDAMQAAQAEIDNVLRLFGAMLRLAEIGSGAARARFARVDLAAVLERVTDAYRPDVETAGHALVLGAIERTPIQGDMDLLAQAIANLIENAMRHTPVGTTISLNLMKRDEEIELAVQDNGAGIADADRQRVLEPFVRLDPSRASTGAGLGLSIVDAIARLHGGRLALEDAKPGLRAVLCLPRA